MIIERIRRVETWLINRRFIPLVILLVLLNLIVYFWWIKRPLIIQSAADVSNSVLIGLRAERDRLHGLLNGPCDSPGMNAYRRGEFGPVDASPNPGADAAPSNPNTQTENSPGVKPRAELVKLLENSTVRVLAMSKNSTGGATGTGFFINDEYVVTNQHVISEADKAKIFVTSKALGGKPVQVQVASATPNHEFFSPDFALLRVVGPHPAMSKLPVGAVPEVMQNVVAAGYPGVAVEGDANAVTPNTVYSQGDVSALQPRPNGVTVILHTANFSPGSSGGPLINRCGSLVGVNTFLNKDETSGRALYSLSAKNLREFLDKSGVSYTKSEGSCASGSN